MRHRTAVVLALTALTLPLLVLGQKKAAAPADDQSSLVITFKDGRQKSYSMSDIARIEVNTPARAAVATKGQNRFLGKWRVGDGAGSHFFITLKEDGVAEKTTGASHGTWVVVDNEARISWDDGWHDTIRKTGSSFEKVAHRPGRSFTDEPDNVTKADLTEAQPL
ncbi:MAG TPA: hypothetical protein VLT90_16525 [Terriglobales bacterium]|nr:hypothetical protein [Terriglobales bacterium]